MVNILYHFDWVFTISENLLSEKAEKISFDLWWILSQSVFFGCDTYLVEMVQYPLERYDQLEWAHPLGSQDQTYFCSCEPSGQLSMLPLELCKGHWRMGTQHWRIGTQHWFSTFMVAPKINTKTSCSIKLHECMRGRTCRKASRWLNLRTIQPWHWRDNSIKTPPHTKDILCQWHI